MKSFLLASASIVAFAGVASAQTIDVPGTPVSFGAEAELGFNDEEEDGYFYSADLLVGIETELTDGFTTTIEFAIPVVSDTLTGESENASDFVIAISAEGLGGFFFGDTNFAAEAHWDPGFSMASDDFSEQDNETAIRGESTIFGFDVSLSTVIADPQGDQPGAVYDEGLPPGVDQSTDDDRDIYTDQISVGATGSVGLFALDFAYQEDSDMLVEPEDGELEGRYDTDNGDFTTAELIAVAAGLTFRGADLKFGYAHNLSIDDGDGADSYGVLATLPVGPLAVSASYTFEPDAELYRDEQEIDDVEDFSYRVGAVYETERLDLGAYYEEEIGEYKYGIDLGFDYSDVTQLSAGYIEDEDEGDDNGYYAGVRVGIGPAGFIEGSYAEYSDAGPFEYREGSTVLVGFTF